MGLRERVGASVWARGISYETSLVGVLLSLEPLRPVPSLGWTLREHTAPLTSQPGPASCSVLG